MKSRKEGRRQDTKKYCLPFTGLRVNLRCSMAERKKEETGS